MSSAEQRVREVLNKLLRKSGLNKGTAVQKIRGEDLTLTLRAVHEGLAALYPELTGVTANGSLVGTIRWKEKPSEEEPEDIREWRAALLAVLQSDDPRALALWSPPAAVLALDSEDQAMLLQQVAELPSHAIDSDPYVFSASHLMGSSKLIDSLGLSPLYANEAAGRPLFAITAGPENPDALVFIENPSAFSAVMSGPLTERNMAICAFGYGLTLENLARRLEGRRLIACPAIGEKVDLSTLIFKKPCFYWGDLDLEGLRIYEVMKNAIPHLVLPAIYELMDCQLDDRRRSHPYSSLFGSGKPRQRHPKAELPEIRYLANRCRFRAVDQEALCPVEDVGCLLRPYERSTTLSAASPELTPSMNDTTSAY